MLEQNLSEQLFKDVTRYPETSVLIRRSTKVYKTLRSDEPRWYRLLTKVSWLWQGIHYADISEVLARIAVSNNPRTNENLLDTVIGYRSGNWIYEWSRLAHRWQQRAQACHDATTAAQNWLQAANLYSVACYPHLQGDHLANQAEQLMNIAYQHAFDHFDYPRKTLTFEFEGRKLRGTLYLPNNDNAPYPTILLCANIANLQSDYYQLFRQYLAPIDFAMLCVDIPAIGHSSQWKLSTDSSKLHQHVLQQLSTIPWIDHHNVFALGFLFGANIAVRLAYLEPKRLRGVISWNGIVHNMLVNHDVEQSISDMYRDVLVSRIGLSSISDTVLDTEMSRYSLKIQGLLGRRCSTPMLSICLYDHLYHAFADAKLIASSSQDGKFVAINSTEGQNHMNLSMQQIVQWLLAKKGN